MSDLRPILNPEIAAAPALSRGDRHPALGIVQSFLEQYGYLQREVAQTGVLDGATSDAIRSYQAFRKLATTGELDPATRDQMSRPRCGNPDLDGGLRFMTVCPTKTLNLAYHMGKGTPDVPDRDAFDAVTRAFATWAATGHFCFREVAESERPDFKLSWVAPDDPEYDLPSWAAAHADYPCGHNKPFQHVHFNDDSINWGLIDYFPFRIDIETVALHEIGHLLGLGHSDVRDSVMWPDYPQTERRTLHVDDIAALNSLYGMSPGRLATSYVFEVRHHFGNEPNSLPGQFVNQAKEFSFDCPRVDGSQSAVLLFQAMGVSAERNQLTINGQVVFGDVPRTADGPAWAGQVLLVRPGVLKPVKNILKIESRTSSGASSGDIDDFVIDNVTVLYPTISCGLITPSRERASSAAESIPG